MKKATGIALLLLLTTQALAWGFYAHRQINYHAVFLLPPDMLVLYKPHIGFLHDHATDADKRRYVLPAEAPRHYIDLDHYGSYPYDSLPRGWEAAVDRFSADSLMTHGILPWWIQTMLYRLTHAFIEKNQSKILKLSADIAHYIADAHVPLHTCSNYNGQLTNQHGIHSFWESRIPELLAEKEWDFFIGRAAYIDHPSQFIWARILESAAAADTVLSVEKQLSRQYAPDRKFAFEERNGIVIRNYSTAYTLTYNTMLNNMVERRMRQSIYAVASFWYTAWINAGQPQLSALRHHHFTEEEQKEFEELNRQWQTGSIKGKSCN